MTTYQTGSNLLAAVKRETTTGTAATASGATQIRALSSPGLVLNRAQIQSAEKRSDMLKQIGRLGSKSVTGSYNAELTVGGATDIFLEAILRASASAAVTLTSSDFTTITTTTSTIVFASGSPIALGVRVGGIVVLTASAQALNNNINLRVTGVTSTTITVAGTPLTLNATPDSTATLKVLKKIVSGTTPTRFSHTIEQYNTDIDLSELFLGCRAINLKLSFKPGAMAQISYGFLGLDRTILTTGTSPWFTSPSVTTGLDLIADDSQIRYNGAAVATFTGMDLDFTITAKGEPVIGSFVSPDVFDNDLMVSGSITSLRSDFTNLSAFDAETEFEISALFQEPTGTPKGCLGLYLPRVKVSAVSAPIFGDGAMVETLTLMTGAKVASSGIDAGVASFFSSAP